MSFGLGLPTSAPAGNVNLNASTIGSGLAALLQGLVQGKEIGLQQQMQRQQIQDDQTRNATDLLPLYQQMARLGVNIDPGKANAALAPLGINLGNQVPSNFGQIDPATLAQNPQMIAALSTLPPETRGIFKSYLGNALPASFWTEPQRMEPQQATSVLNDLRMQRYELLMQGADPKSDAIKNLDSQMAQIEQGIPGFPQSPGVDTSTAFGSGPTKAQANIAYTGARTQMTSDQDKKIITQTKWITPLNQAVLAKDKAQTLYFDAQGAAIPARVAQGWARVEVARKNADTAYARLQEDKKRTIVMAQNADANAARTAHQAFNDALVQIRSDEALKARYKSMLDGMEKANKGTGWFGQKADLTKNASYQQLLQNYKTVNDRIYQERQFATNFPAFMKTVRTQVIHKQGAPPSYSAGNTDNAPKVLTQAGLQKYAKDHNMSVQAASAQAKSFGYTIQP